MGETQRLTYLKAEFTVRRDWDSRGRVWEGSARCTAVDEATEEEVDLAYACIYIFEADGFAPGDLAEYGDGQSQDMHRVTWWLEKLLAGWRGEDVDEAFELDQHVEYLDRVFVLDKLVVAERFRGQGYGKRAMRLMLAAAGAEDKPVALVVEADARGFWDSFGDEMLSSNCGDYRLFPKLTCSADDRG